MVRARERYQPRRAEASVLHGVIRDHLDEFLRAAAGRADGSGLPYVGVGLRNMSAQEAAYFGLRTPAVLVGSVVPNGSAYKAGLRDGDAVTSVDGQEVSDAKVVAELFRAHKAGDKVRMSIVHIMDDGRRVAIELGIVAEPRPPNYGFDPTQSGRLPGSPPPPAVPGQASGTMSENRLNVIYAPSTLS
jgi:predicted metalloprotease with PDZ domain